MLQTYRTVVYMWLTRMSEKPIAIKLIAQYACMHISVIWCCVTVQVVHIAVQEKVLFDCLTLKMKMLQSFEKSETTPTTTHHQIPEDLTLKHWNIFLFLYKQTTLLCVCGLTQQNKKHNTHNSLKHTSCCMYNDSAFQTVHFSHWVYSHVQFSE